MRRYSIHLLSFRPFLQNGLFCGGCLLLRLHFPRLPLLPTLEPGAGSSHPGNVRRQEPPGRCQLGHPIRRKSESSLAMAGPAANQSHPLQPPLSCSGDTFPLTPAQCASPPSSILNRQSQMRLGVGKSKPATLRASDLLTAAASRDARWRAHVYVCARDRRAGRRILRSCAADTHVTHQEEEKILDSKIMTKSD